MPAFDLAIQASTAAASAPHARLSPCPTMARVNPVLTFVTFDELLVVDDSSP